MPDFTVRSDSVNVEQIMEQIRARIREKRGVDYTEAQIRELASVKLEKFLDPRVVRSDLLQQFQRSQAAKAGSSSITFGPNAIFEAQRPLVAKIRRLLHPVLRLFFNPDPISQALVRLNDIDPRADMYYELFHNLVIELTRTGIEVKNLKMQIESLTGRLEFNERRARALESVVVYRPSEDAPATPGFRPGGQGPRGSETSRGSYNAPRPQPAATGGQSSQGSMPSSPSSNSPAYVTPSPGAAEPSTAAGQPVEGPGQRSRRRRRRRGRRGGGSAASILGAPADPNALPSDPGPNAGQVQDQGGDENASYEASTGAESSGESLPEAGSGDDPSDGPDSNGEQ